MAAASREKAFITSIAARPLLKLEIGVPCISSPPSSRTTVQPQDLSRLSSHVFKAAAPPTCRPADHGQGLGIKAPWRSVIARTRRMVLSPSLTLGVTGENARKAASRAG